MTMKTSFKYLLVASMLAIGFTSCSKDDDVKKGEDGQDEKNASLTIRIKNPSTYATEEGTAAESTVQNAYVIFFNPGGSYSAHEFADNLTGVDTFSVKAPVGEKIIYVGINLNKSDGTSRFVQDVAAKLAAENNIFAEHTVALPSDLSVANWFTMFSTEGIAKELKEDGNNVVDVQVERMVSKVASVDNVSKRDSISAANFYGLEFAIGQANTKIYAMQNRLPSGLVKDPNYEGTIDQSLTPPNVTYYQDFYDEFGTLGNVTYNAYNLVAPKATATKDTLNKYAKYAPENTSITQYKGELTFASVKAEFSPCFLSSYTKSNDSLSIVDNPKAGEYVKRDYYVVRDNAAQYYYFLDETEANDFYTENLGSEGKKDTYFDGYCYYPVFLNSTGTGNEIYDVLRNKYYQLTVNKISSLGNPGPGIVDPWVPIGKETDLEVVIDIVDWTIVPEDVDLGSTL